MRPCRGFESGAILWYLGKKTSQFAPADLRGQTQTLQWLFWQVAGRGPMAGRNQHCAQYAPERLPYAIERYGKETHRLYAVLEQRLAEQPYVAAERHTVADITCYPWIASHERLRQNPEDIPHLKRWLTQIGARPATVRAYGRAPQFGAQSVGAVQTPQTPTDQTAACGGPQLGEPVR